MTAAFQHPTTGPAHLSGSRCASCRRAPRFRNTRPAKRVAGQKTAPRNFSRATPKPRRELLPQVTGTHLESRTYRYVFAPGCVVAPNSTATTNSGGTVQISLGYKPVVIFGVPTGEYHTFVVATNLATGEQIITRGGPSANGVDNPSATLGSSSAGGSVAGSSGNGSSGGFGFGTIYGQGGTSWTENSADPPSQTVAMQPVGNVSMTLSQVSGAMNQFQSVTNSNGIPYFPLGLNSNSYAFTFVQSLGLPRPQPAQGFPAPGSSLGTPSPTLTYGHHP